MKESGKLLGALDEHDGHIAHGDEHDGDWERHEIGASGDNDCRGHDGTKDLTDGVGDIEDAQVLAGVLLIGQNIDIERLVHGRVDTVAKSGEQSKSVHADNGLK